MTKPAVLIVMLLSLVPLNVSLAQNSSPSLDQQLQHAWDAENADRRSFELATRADVNARDKLGDTALYKAAEHGDVETVRVLLQRGADANARDDFGLTPLTAAAQLGALDVIEALLNAGANVHSRTSHGSTPVSFAVLGNKLEEVSDKLAAVKLLIEHGADFQSGGDRGETPLMTAARSDQDLIVLQYLLQKGATLETKDDVGDAALGYAAKSMQVKSLQTLLDHGAKIDTRNNAGATPLMLAAATGYPDTVKLLLVRGAEIHLKDIKRHDALFYASQKTYLGPAMKQKTIRLLQTYGAR